ncbi:MAG TPA: neutral zinc metallopeptidase, partial [Longimicrobiaceae bacterium]|nr:neutral zinc metallopeptidase [Longimicrobiaceae bacterium]
MRWQGRRGSGNVQDRRGMGRVVAGGGVGAVIIAIVVMLLGGDPSAVIQQAPPSAGPATAQTDSMSRFVAVVLADTEEVWKEIFRDSFGESYPEPTLVLFSGAVNSACGFAQAAMGPFYCPLDRQVYIDLAFYDDLRTRLGAPGDFAQAYVIAHEVG